MLSTTSQSLVLFGVEKLSNYLICEVVLYYESLPKTAIVKDCEGNKYKLYIPKEIQNSLTPGIAKDLTFLIDI